MLASIARYGGDRHLWVVWGAEDFVAIEAFGKAKEARSATARGRESGQVG